MASPALTRTPRLWPRGSTLVGLASVVVLWALYWNAVEFIAKDVLHDPGMSVSRNFRNELHGYILSPADAPPLARWDSVWYQSIATEGYPAPRGIGYYNVGFLPLYGLMMRAVALRAHVHVLVAGVWVARAALLGAMLLLWFEARSRVERESEAWAPLTALLAFPSAFLLVSVYAESSFLFFALAAWLLAQRRHWFLAFVPAFAAAVTRMHALALLPGLFVMGFFQWWPDRKKLASLGAFVPALGVAAGLGSLALYFQRIAHDPLLYFTRKRFFGSVTGGPKVTWTSSWQNFHIALEQHTFGALYTLMEIPCAALLLVAAITLVVRRRYGEACYVLATLSLSVAAGSLWGLPRYCLLLFPLFLLAIVPARRTAVWTGCVIGSAMLQACLLTHYVNLQLPAP